MEFGDVLRRRHMVRDYTDQLVDPSSVERILDAGISAPSAGFSQGQRFILITDPDIRRAVSKVAREEQYLKRGFNPWISRAPVLILICSDKQAYLDRYSESDKNGVNDWTVPYWWLDAGASLMAILHAATNEGLAAGFLGGHSLVGIHDVLDIPDEILVAGVVTIGHSGESGAEVEVREGSSRRGRVPRESIVHLEHW